MLKNPHHQKIITIVEHKGKDDQKSYKSKALTLRLIRFLRVEDEYVIGCKDTVDIMLTNSVTGYWYENRSFISSLHCAIFIDDIRRPWVRDGSINRIIIDGKLYNRRNAMRIKNGMKIKIRDFGFLIYIP